MHGIMTHYYILFHFISKFNEFSSAKKHVLQKYCIIKLLLYQINPVSTMFYLTFTV